MLGVKEAARHHYTLCRNDHTGLASAQPQRRLAWSRRRARIEGGPARVCSEDVGLRALFAKTRPAICLSSTGAPRKRRDACHTETNARLACEYIMPPRPSASRSWYPGCALNLLTYSSATQAPAVQLFQRAIAHGDRRAIIAGGRSFTYLFTQLTLEPPSLLDHRQLQKPPARLQRRRLYVIVTVRSPCFTSSVDQFNLAHRDMKEARVAFLTPPDYSYPMAQWGVRG